MSVRVTLAYLAALAALALLFAWPLIVHGAPDLSNDALQHVIYANNFSPQFWNGDLYPRWLMNSNSGLGSPVFFFYPPLPSFVAALFWPLTGHGGGNPGSMVTGYELALGLLLSGLTAWFWLRTLAPPGAAFAGAVVYLLAPYHLAINLYNRGAVAEFWLFVWLPLILWFAHGMVERNRWAPAGLAVAYAMCVLSHPTVALCFAAIPFAYVLLFSEPRRRIVASLQAAGAFALGVALPAVFILPAVLDQGKVHADIQTTGFGDYRSWWLFNIRDRIAEAGAKSAQVPLLLNFKVRILVIAVTALLFILILFWLLRAAKASKPVLRVGWFYLVVALVTFFLMLEQSDIFWRFIPALKLLQSPSRLNTMLTVCAAAVAALAFPCLALLRMPLRVLALLMAGGILTAWIGADTWSARWAFSAWRSVPAERLAFVQRNLETGRDMYGGWALPREANPEQFGDFPVYDAFVARNPPKTVMLAAARPGQASGSAAVARWDPRRIRIHVDSPGAARLVVRHFYYAGWIASIPERGQSVAVKPLRPEGLMELEVPAGRYDLVLELSREAPERAGMAISAVSVLVLVAGAAWMALRRGASTVSASMY